MGKNRNNTKNSFLKSVLVLTIFASFSVLIIGGYWIFESAAPRPTTIIDSESHTVMTKESIVGGQAVFQKYALMDYGSVLGYGSYLGPDYTAEALKIYTEGMQAYQAEEKFGKPKEELTSEEQTIIQQDVIDEMRVNRYDAASDTLTLTAAQTAGVEKVREFYREVFTKGDGWGLLPGLIQEEHMPEEGRAWVSDGDQITQISDFFFWTAWISSTLREDDDITYTNNWPYYEEAGNTMPLSAVWWSAASVTILVLLVAVILYFFYRYQFGMQEAYGKGRFPQYHLNSLPLTPSQEKTGKYITVVILLFFVQVMFGGLLAHYYAEPDSFYGMDFIADIFPFSIAKGFHLQLAIFWIATSWLAMGIYIAPVVGGREPKRQGLLVNILFWALVFLVGGSLIGQWLGAQGKLGNLWFIFGHQGWEYLELGRFWQYVLAAGMAIWLFIVWRGIHSGLKQEKDRGGLIHLLFYSAIAVPAFYIFAFFINPGSHFTMADYWRWWLVHLWVEGIFEVFAVVVIGFLLVYMRLVTKSSVVRTLYFQLTLLLGSGVIGIGHHYYYNGSAEVWIALGAVFSALEVIPLTLLILEAYEQYKMMRDGGVMFPYKASFWFLISTAVWNLLGAGVLGFLINLPAANYFEHGQYLTAAHAHGSMMGVYGMFAIAVILFTLRNIIKPGAWNEKLIKISLWGLNLGLAGMILITLLPIGYFQFKTAFESGYWASRAVEFYQQDIIQTLLAWRALPDSIFIVFGVVPLLILTVKALFHLRAVTHGEGEELPEQIDDSQSPEPLEQELK
ncbi:nitric oxide reductase subunit B [Evansella caseinilytica]|uniref:Nitric oxide reductase subunit B n=1 Tax=Evansella caseinilytica TaxID=1503961 RepID=A0A1H3GLZ4_9BACI|nr:cbb3-type cytochrome c oxidase subunit I [Evansella caseinilytica]SDY03658.1 nitric oxide reductase subunit B [Evansella caseinilytica]